MKAIIFVAFLTICLCKSSFVFGNYKGSNQMHWWDTDDSNIYGKPGNSRIPFPECLLSKSGSKLFGASSFQKLFDEKLQEEEEMLKDEVSANYENENYGTYDDDETDNRRQTGKGRTAARAALKVTRDILTVLMCDLNGTSTDNLQNILNKVNIPNEFCSFLDKPDCSEKSLYRTIDGVCNNINNPYQGSSQTAYSRLLPAAYDDHLGEPRRRSVKGGYLPSCRYISLNFGSRPIFDRNFNNLFVSFGQYIGHDVSLAVPVSDTYARPISSCSCDDIYNWDKCTVIPISPDDPYLRGQKCMTFPATAQAFKNQVCSLGVKEQMNGNTHFVDLSNLYGSNTRIAQALRSNNGLLKSTRPQWSSMEYPPGQREGKSCTDSKPKRKCFAGGDTRLMITPTFTGIQTMFLRFHNQIARAFHTAHPTWTSNQIYEETRTLTIAMFQRIVYQEFLPILIGPELSQIFTTNGRTDYDPDVSPTVSNEFATAVFRLHSLVRDLFTRCTYDGKRIDDLWLVDVVHKSKYDYDAENNGIDAFICGALHDYGFAYDGNFAHQIHNRLFETSNNYNQFWRNDLVSINICRGREHGIPSYNELRKFCGLTKAESFEDFGDTINYVGVKALKNLYRSTHDVDAFTGLNYEDPVKNGILGAVGSCIVRKQFETLRNGDRFFYSHNGALTDAQLQYINGYSYVCLVCDTSQQQGVPQNPFKPPSDDNPMVDCSSCPTNIAPPASGKIPD